jgi:uncharacterized membrane protein
MTAVHCGPKRRDAADSAREADGNRWRRAGLAEQLVEAAQAEAVADDVRRHDADNACKQAVVCAAGSWQTVTVAVMRRGNLEAKRGGP